MPGRLDLALLSMPRARLNFVVAIIVIHGLTGMPPWLGILLLCLGILCYVPMIRIPAASLEAQRTACQDLRSDVEVYEAQAREQAARIARLEADLVRVRAEARPQAGSDDDPLYRRVGLTDQAPDWLVQAARRTYRARLHPDRHPRHRAQAHARPAGRGDLRPDLQPSRSSSLKSVQQPDDRRRRALEARRLRPRPRAAVSLDGRAGSNTNPR